MRTLTSPALVRASSAPRPHVVVLGAGYAGLLASLRLARRVRGLCDITLVSASAHFVERVRLHERAAGAPKPVFSLRAFLARTDVAFRQGFASSIDVRARTVIVDGEPLAYDTLVYALGSRVDTGSLLGVREHAYTLDAASAGRLAAELPPLAARHARVLVVGGGLTAIEAATEIAEAYPSLRVTLAASSLGAQLSSRARAHLRASLARLAITLDEGARVRSLEAGRALLADGRELVFDACVWAGGFVAPSLARDAGLAVNARGQLRVDRCLRALGHPEIYGAGDASLPEHDPGSSVEMSCKTAMPMGAHVADNLARALRNEGLEPFTYRDSGYCISLGRRDGIIESKRADGSPGVTLTGRAAAFVKERVVRYTTLSLRAERAGLWRYRWLHPSRAALAAQRNETRSPATTR